MHRWRLVRVLIVGAALAVAAGCAPPVPLRLPVLYSDGFFGGGLATEIAPLQCADVHATLTGEANVSVEDQPTGAVLGTTSGRVEVDFCRPDGDGTRFDVTGRMAFTCCASPPGPMGDNVFSGPARVRRDGSRLTVDLDIQQGTRGYRGATGVCTLDGDVMSGFPDPPPPSRVSVSGGFSCRIGGPNGPPPPPSFRIATFELPEPVVGQPYLAMLGATGGTPPYRWRVTGLPTGLTSRSDGAIYGASAEPGESLVEATVRDAAGLTRSITLSLWTQDPDVVGSIEEVTSLERIPGAGQISVSDDGRVVAFMSDATDLTDPPGRPFTSDVFVWDRTTDVVRRITNDTEEGNFDVQISGDGSTVVFLTYQALAPDDTNGDLDVYLADAATGALRRVSGEGANSSGAVTPDGRLVVFTQWITGPGGRMGVYVWDRATGAATEIAEGDNSSCCVDISDDGSRVTVLSAATDLVPDDTNGHADVFVIDRPTGEITRLDTGTDRIWAARISGDGSTVAIVSDGTGFLPPGESDTNDGGDLFRADVATGTITRLTNGDVASDVYPSISDDGRAIAFTSAATNLAPGERDTGGLGDVFLWDGDRGTTSRLTRSRTGHAAVLELSGDGRSILFSSNATDLVPDGPTSPEVPSLYRWTRSS